MMTDPVYYPMTEPMRDPDTAQDYLDAEADRRWHEEAEDAVISRRNHA